MNYIKNIYNKIANRNVIKKLDVVRIPNPITDNYNQNITNQNITNQNQLNVASWNIEDFVSIVELYNSENQVFLNKLRQQDIILIQEWKNTNYEGDLFICKLNNNLIKYSYNSVDRVSVIYNTELFDKTKTIHYKIPLAYEAPTMLEKTYTTGRQKYNMLTILFPINNAKLPICVINFHLSAFSPQYHPGFHKKQMNELLQTSLQKINDENITQFGLIIGGDTNYRNLGNDSNNLLGSLISLNRLCKTDNNCRNGKLRDVCETNKTNCLKTKTQSFECVHEKNREKQGIKSLRKNFYTDIDIPTSSIHDNRLDFIATNLKINDITEILKLCNLSDHSAILSKMTWEIDNMNEAVKHDLYKPSDYNSDFSGGMRSSRKNKFGLTKYKNTKNKSKKNKSKKSYTNRKNKIQL